jgi:hypothetical protein
MYPLVESVHVLTLCLFVGMAALLDLRLLGVTLRKVPVSELADRVFPWMLAGFVIMVISGVALFYAIPIRSWQSVWFRMKVILLILAGLNAWRYHSTVHRRVAEWENDPVTPARARFAGAASLTLWAFIIIFGRMIAYNWFDCDRQPQPAIINWAAGCVVEPTEQ